MKERPILMSAPMVRAILAGTKTQTRRIVKPQPPEGCEYVINGAQSHALCRAIDAPSIWVAPTPKSIDHRLPCPYGSPGDRLWVKETLQRQGEGFVAYAADGDTCWSQEDASQAINWPWKRSKQVSIHMPRWASRITLEVVSVRVERLHDISEGDAKAEGVEWAPWHDYPPVTIGGRVFGPAFAAYKELWEQISGPGSWQDNPWVWAISFKRVEGGAA